MTESDGYVLVSTLFFLMLSGLFAQSIIQISSNYVTQLRQVSIGYEAKAALNMCEELIVQKHEEETPSIKGTISDQIIYQLTLVKENGDIYNKKVSLPLSEE